MHSVLGELFYCTFGVFFYGIFSFANFENIFFLTCGLIEINFYKQFSDHPLTDFD